MSHNPKELHLSWVTWGVAYKETTWTLQNNQIILHKWQITIDHNNFRLPYITPKPKQIVLMDTQLPPDTKIELAYGGNHDP